MGVDSSGVRRWPVAENEKKNQRTRADRFAHEHGEALVEHMAKGFSFRSFAANSSIPYSTLLTWAEKNKNFQKYKELGEAKSLLYWETIGIAATQGQLRRVKSEKVKKTTFFDENGQVEKDGNGAPAIKEEIIERETETVPLSQSMWTFVMRSRFGWVPEGPDLMDPENNPGNRLKKFQLTYSTKDQPYVVKDREAKDGKGKDDSGAQPGAESGSSEEAGSGVEDRNSGVGSKP